MNDIDMARWKRIAKVDNLRHSRDETIAYFELSKALLRIDIDYDAYW